MAYLNELVAECLQDEPAFCTAACPFNFDVRDFIGKLQQGRFNVAFKTYQNAVGFPGIVSSLCNEPCRNVCALKDAGGSIFIRMLEKASIDFARNTNPDNYNIPAKNNRIAVIGGGISGLACALRLATRKYPVTVFEMSDRIGGHLHGLMKPELFMDDIARQFMNETYTLSLNTEITDIRSLNFEAYYIATGKGGNDFGLNTGGREGIFRGGSLTGADTMQAIAQGLEAANSIETFLKTGKMNRPEPPSGTKLTYDAVRIPESVPVVPSDGSNYNKDEASAEAKRCIKCTCDACVYYSPLLNYFQKFPKRVTEEVEITIHPSTLDGAGTFATRFISTCNYCGLCKQVCPKDIDTGAFLLRSHRTMREKGAMPWAFHEFFMRDMDFSNGEASLVKDPPGGEKCSYLFFPGCQLGASDPEYVRGSYRFLTDNFPGTALMLGCCGAPAEWAGDEPVHAKVIENIRSAWTSLGKPVIILACPTCNLMFRNYLPETESVFLFNLMAEKGFGPRGTFSNVKASVFDPCASRNEPGLQDAVRRLASGAGFQLEPLPMEGKMAECCSYGGQIAIANPPYTSHMVEDRISRNNNPYITYCSNCRDIFTSAGKKTWHILDIALGLKTEGRKLPTVTDRRDNRLKLRDMLLKEFWKEKVTMNRPAGKLILSDDLRDKLNRQMILETDLLNVIRNCEEKGEKLMDAGKGTFLGHMQIGNMTYWVEYRVTAPDEYELINGYSHRMKIEEA